MCGIFCSIIYNQNTFLNAISKKGCLVDTNSEFEKSYPGFIGRGPDSFQELDVDVNECTLLRFAGCVLWTQGPVVVKQPILDSDGNVLLWNGDIFGGPLGGEGNDAEKLSSHLQTVNKEDDILKVFSELRGPYSFIYYLAEQKRVYFGRDVIGRHSLLINLQQGNITISSVSNRLENEVCEVPAVGIFYFDLKEDGETPLVLHPWSHINSDLMQLKLSGFPRLDKLRISEPLASCLELRDRKGEEPNETDLSMWIVFRNELSMSQLMDKLNAGDSKTRIKRTMSALSEKQDLRILVEDLLKSLKDSLKVRLETLPRFCKDCTIANCHIADESFRCPHSKVAILFSGGLDSAILSFLADAYVPEDEPIDLLNVAFERSRDLPDFKPARNNSFRRQSAHGVYSIVQEVTYLVPDRETGLQTLMELRTLLPNRKWNFVEINVTQEELKREREEHISDLIHPLHTVLDDSLGCALWFASRGRGVLTNTGKQPYTSPARIVVSGIGADEQLGGYMRHRTTLMHKGGWPAIDRELSLELGRIGERNLGRDDRVAASHGRQLRMPYLDENLVNFLSFLPPWQRCNPVEAMPPGLGDKLLLRLVAWHLGLRNAANLPKRAMQFGSRIANSREKGDAVSDRLQ